MDWFPIVFVTFKLLVLGTGMFFAVKWHYDQGKKKAGTENEPGAVLRATGKAAAIFMLSLLGLGLITMVVLKNLRLDLT